MKYLLQEALDEIRSLRRSNEVLGAQVEVVEVFATALGMRKDRQGMAEDVAWKLMRKIEELEQPISK